MWFVVDKAVGPDMLYAANLFETFHRLHRTDEYEGTGIGLALAANARDAMPTGGALGITTSTLEQADDDLDLGLVAGSYVTLEVRDTGSGIGPMAQRHIFESLYTNDAMVARGVLPAGMLFLQKPFTATQLGATERQALAGVRA